LTLEKRLSGFRPHGRLFINVHLDGMEAAHDRLVQRAGAFAAAVAGIRAAKAAGFAVCTNTTIYKQTDVHEIAVLFGYLTELGVDGLMIAPAYGYEAVQEDDAAGAEQLFMTRAEVHEKFLALRPLLGKFRLFATPIYMEFLCGLRELSCAAWANPTRNIRGWRSPCYLIADSHCTTHRQLIHQTDWSAFGPGKDPRCEHCLMHCGFEPAAVLAANRGFRDAMKMAVWQMS
jgi:hopanoid biosynthesis associated radical SAM protein HpnH